MIRAEKNYDPYKNAMQEKEHTTSLLNKIFPSTKHSERVRAGKTYVICVESEARRVYEIISLLLHFKGDYRLFLKALRSVLTESYMWTQLQ